MFAKCGKSRRCSIVNLCTFLCASRPCWRGTAGENILNRDALRKSVFAKRTQSLFDKESDGTWATAFSHSMTNRRTTSRSWRCSERSDKRRAINFDSVAVQLLKNHVNRNRPPRVYIQPRFASFESNEPSSREPREMFRKRRAPANPLGFPPHPIGRGRCSMEKVSAIGSAAPTQPSGDFQIRTRVVTAQPRNEFWL